MLSRPSRRPIRLPNERQSRNKVLSCRHQVDRAESPGIVERDVAVERADAVVNGGHHLEATKLSLRLVPPTLRREHERDDRPEREVPLEYGMDDFRFLGIDDKLLVDGVIAERGKPTHPHSSSLGERDLVSYPERSRYDLVGIDNRRAGYVVTQHLIRCGCRKIVFLGRPGSAPTVDARIAGYREAVADAGLKSGPHVCRVNPEDQVQVKKILQQIRPDGIVCANDFTAARLLRTLTDLGVAVPDKVRMAGIDDVKYASLLSVPLTTIHQPCAMMGAIAVSTMIERVRDPKLPARDILLNFHLVVRDSCGARKKKLTSIP